MSRSSNFSYKSSKSDPGCLPIPITRRTCSTAAVKLYRYLRKLFNFNQMDFEFASWQMMYLFVNPHKVYRNFQYRNVTKSQFARDDPAFLVLLAAVLFGSSIGFAMLLRLDMLGFLKFFLYFVLVDCIAIGIFISTCLWFITNKYMVKQSWLGYNVEWGYAFDVHLNAFTPLVVISHMNLLFIHHIFGRGNQYLFIVRFLANSAWLTATSFYIYITFLGYKYLPFLRGAESLLLLIVFAFFVYLIVMITGGNMNETMMDFYRYMIF
ncbi:protein unc-50 homolog [Planococcus citri]|uniref:protein unc-50 homolog n=1 Tax=Planococcus citri TaxID=170843 RepID=UPI0031F8B22D